MTKIDYSLFADERAEQERRERQGQLNLSAVERDEARVAYATAVEQGDDAEFIGVLLRTYQDHTARCWQLYEALQGNRVR